MREEPLLREVENVLQMPIRRRDRNIRENSINDIKKSRKVRYSLLHYGI